MIARGKKKTTMASWISSLFVCIMVACGIQYFFLGVPMSGLPSAGYIVSIVVTEHETGTTITIIDEDDIDELRDMLGDIRYHFGEITMDEPVYSFVITNLDGEKTTVDVSYDGVAYEGDAKEGFGDTAETFCRLLSKMYFTES